ncbi:MAG: ABC transporter permease [Vicinamibacterales bacterium]
MTWLEHVTRDVRHAGRTIARMPILATVVIVSLAVGIGVNVVVFSWIQAVMLKPLPGVADARSFYFVEPRAETGTHPGASWLEYRDLTERLRSFRELLAFRMVPFNVGEAARTERMYGLLVSGNYFSALGLRPALGRFFGPDEVARAGAEPVVVVSHGFWQTRFNGSPDAVGQTIRVNDRDLAIVGVTPRGFQGTVLSLDFSLWVPATMAPAMLAGSRELETRAVRGYAVMGRLQPGVTQVQAQAEVGAVMRQLGRLFPSTNETIRGDVMSFWQAARGPQRMIWGALAALQGIMLVLLLAVCGNTANLMLARASTRLREVGIRLALGAGRWRVISILLTESVLLALMGAALGAAIAVWGTDALRAVPMIGAFPIRFQTSVDAAGLAVAVALGVLCGLVFGIAPATQLAGVDPQQALRAGARTASRSRLRNALMGVEVALALIVLVVAAMFFRSVAETRDIDPGFRRDGVLLAAYDLTGRNVGDAAARDFAGKLLDRLRALPGVEAAAIATQVPLDIHGLPLRSFTIEGRARPDGAADQALSNTVTPGYWSAMGIPLLQGTDFAVFADPATPAQAIVNEAFVRRYLADLEPLGRRLENRGRIYTIVAVARNSLYESFGESPTPIVYFSYRDRPSSAGEIHVRTRPGAETTLASDVRRVVRELDMALPIYDVRTLNEHVEKNLFLRRVPARMFVVLGPLLLALAAIGIYAVVAYGVAQRTTEIGVRLALGASGRRVVSGIVRDTLRIVAAGAVPGWLIMYLVQIHIAPGRPLDRLAFMGVPAVLFLVAAIASWLPAQRATAIDPVVALRHE